MKMIKIFKLKVKYTFLNILFSLVKKIEYRNVWLKEITLDLSIKTLEIMMDINRVNKDNES